MPRGREAAASQRPGAVDASGVWSRGGPTQPGVGVAAYRVVVRRRWKQNVMWCCACHEALTAATGDFGDDGGQLRRHRGRGCFCRCRNNRTGGASQLRSGRVGASARLQDKAEVAHAQPNGRRPTMGVQRYVRHAGRAPNAAFADPLYQTLYPGRNIPMSSLPWELARPQPRHTIPTPVKCGKAGYNQAWPVGKGCYANRRQPAHEGRNGKF